MADNLPGLHSRCCSKGWRHSCEQCGSSRFLQDNLVIQSNILAAAHRYDVERLLFWGRLAFIPSCCSAYPRGQPAPEHWSQLTSGMRLQKSQASDCAKHTGSNTVVTGFQQCLLICTALAITMIWRLLMYYPLCFENFTKRKFRVQGRLYFGAQGHLYESSCTATTWRMLWSSSLKLF